MIDRVGRQRTVTVGLRRNKSKLNDLKSRVQGVDRPLRACIDVSRGARPSRTRDVR
mgnify:FL=1